MTAGAEGANRHGQIQSEVATLTATSPVAWFASTMRVLHHNGSRVGSLGEFGRFSSKDGCPGTAALETVPVMMVHPPTATVIVKMAKMAAIVADNRIVSLRDRCPPPISSTPNSLTTIA